MSDGLAPLFVLSGPSGAGKTTLVEAVLHDCRYPLRRAVTATTRPPRSGERDGIDYHFWSVERFRAALANDEMLEHAVVFDRDYYGTPRAEVDEYRKAGSGVLMVIDVQGAEQVRTQYPGDHVSIFLDVPSIEVLERRLRDRNTEDDARIARRLDAARNEIARRGEFDHRVVNDSLPAATRDLLAIFDAEFHRRRVSPCSTN